MIVVIIVLVSGMGGSLSLASYYSFMGNLGRGLGFLFIALYIAILLFILKGGLSIP